MGIWGIEQQKYIDNLDFNGACEKYKSSDNNTIGFWNNALREIAKNAPKTIQIDEKYRVLFSLFRVEAKDAPSFPYGVCGAYIVQHFDLEDNSLWIKVGSSKNIGKRLKQHYLTDYRGEIFSAKCLKYYQTNSAEEAQIIESILRAYFLRKGYSLLGNDRFPDLVEVTNKDWKKLDIVINKIKNDFQELLV